MGENFGCCSRYVECSDAMKCIHPEPDDAIGCAYRKNLEQGRIFYGKNAFLKVVKPLEPEKVANEEPKETKKPEIYLFCYDRLFAVRARNKSGFSFGLSGEQFKKIEDLFKANGIPYKTENIPEQCIIDVPNTDNPVISNSRVVVTVDGEEFHILNYNSYLVREYYAHKIAKALIAKGVKSRVEVLNGFRPVKQIVPQAPVKKVVPIEGSKPKKVVYEQISLFDIA